MRSENKGMIGFPITVDLICAFVFAYKNVGFLMTGLIYMYMYFPKKFRISTKSKESVDQN